MVRPLLVLAAIDGHAATILSHLLTDWEPREVAHDRLAEFTLPPAEHGRVGLVVLQSRTEKEAPIVRACREVRANPALAGARLVVALDPELAGQYSAIRAAGADECLMVPASAGHIEKLLRQLGLLP